jgi:hypothetical protein
MNKSKHFVFFGIAAAVMLLVVGSWATSAQATSTVIIDEIIVKKTSG